MIWGLIPGCWGWIGDDYRSIEYTTLAPMVDPPTRVVMTFHCEMALVSRVSSETEQETLQWSVGLISSLPSRYVDEC